jgi:hypothetical protein
MGLFYVLIGVAALALLLMAARWFASAPPRQVMVGLRWAAALGGGAAAIWLMMTGRAVQVLYLLIPLLPFMKRWWQQMRNAAGAEPGKRSDVETAWLRMSLDHDSNTMDGLVLQGRWRGRRLAELSAAQLLDLLAELRVADGDSAALLEGYLDAVHAGWRGAQAGDDAPGSAPRAAAGAMTREEAYRVLGLAPGAGQEEIRRAWRELMKRNHPDQGGSPYLAAKINEAKELLLGERR